MSAVSNFQSRLSGLADTASKETVQTLSKYMAFNRKKFGSEMTSTLLASIQSAPTSSRKVLLLTVAHEVLVADSSVALGGGNAKKWDRTADFRVLLGENLVVPAAESIRDAAAAEEGDGSDSEASVQRVKDMANVWEEINAFGGPTIAHSVRRVLAAPARRRVSEESSAKSKDATEEETKAEGDVGEADASEAKTAASEAEADAKAESPNGPVAPLPPAEASSMAAAVEASSTAAASKSAESEEKAPSTSAVSPSSAAASASEIKIMETTMGKSDSGGGVDSTDATPTTKGKSPLGTPSVDVANASEVLDADGKPLASAFAAEEGGKKVQSDDGKKSPVPHEEEAKFDFEAEGIKQGKVEARELLEPCKSLASMQIARDLRNDTTVQLSNILGSVPEETMEHCRKVAKAKEDGGDDDGSSEDGPIPTLPDEVLDLDLDEALASVREYRDIISRQRAARMKLIHLLIKSRCKFGSDESAAAFVEAATTIEKLRKRRVMLRDAMELEGLDMVEDVDEAGGRDGEDDDADLAPLEWYKGSGDEPEAKKVRTG